MRLKDTYRKEEIHNEWISVYRQERTQNDFDNQLLDRLLTCVKPPKDALFLDAGCGDGNHTIRIARKGYHCVGVDISENVLLRARLRAEQSGLSSKVTFVCQSLEELAFEDGVFDVVHCRGVLMHIPEWNEALGQLCRVLKPGGQLILMESNSTSFEIRVVQLVRYLKERKSKLVKTPTGIEFWSDFHGSPFVVRYANIKVLIDHLQVGGVDILERFSTQFWDIKRFPAGFRKVVILFNRLAFHFHFPPSLCVGNGIVGQKRM